MHLREPVTLQRDCTAIQIPDGTPVTLEAGTPATITQALGDTYTIMTPYGLMARIDAQDADALGKEIAATVEPTGGDETPFEDQVWSQLKKCYDPEIPVNIVDLGLVYDCQVEDLPDGLRRVTVKMTLTAPGCGMGDILADDVRRRIEGLARVSEADVEVVFDPQWNMDMMTEAARLQLGLL